MSFIFDIAPHAQRHMRESNILASLIIAQAIHESNWGKSGLATKGKNLFGIKGTYGGKSVTMPTWEVYNGKTVQVNAAFRKYPSWYESIADLVSLYKNGVSWDRKKYHSVIGEKDYKKACKAIQAAGYATDPNYASKLIRTIEANELTQFDGNKAAKPVAKPATKPKPTNSSGIKAIGKIKIVGVKTAAIIMDSPDREKAKNIGTIKKNATISIAGSDKGKNNPKGYWEVIHNGKRAYVSGQYGKLM